MRVLIAAAAVVFATAAPAADPPAIDPAVVPGTFALAVSADPVRLDKAATAAGLPLDVLWKITTDATGVEPKKLRRATVYVEPFPGGNVMFFPAVALRYADKIDGKAKATELLGAVTPATTKEVAYLKSDKVKMAKTEIAGYPAADGSLLIAPWPTLEQMLAASTEKARPLAAELATTNLDHDLVLVFQPKPFLASLKRVSNGKDPNIPDEFADLWAGLKHLDSATLTLDLTADTVLRATLRADAPADAKAVETGLKQALAAGKAALPTVKGMIETAVPENGRAAATALVEAIVTGGTVKVDGATVVLTVPRPASSKK